MAEPSVVHSSFTIERTYPAPPARVFAAFANQETKRRWFAEAERSEVREFALDFRVGGHDVSRFRHKAPIPGHQEAPEFRNDTTYLDIIPDRRIVFAYTMAMAGTRISASLATVEILGAEGGTRLRFTEQAAFFEGADGPEIRQKGWNSLLESLGSELRGSR